METSEQRYLPSKDICNRFDITGSTLRKWCIALEKQGYDFARTEQNRRLFVEHDMEVLEHLKHLIQDRNMTLENASIIVASKYAGARSSERTPSVPPRNNDGVSSNDVIKKLNEHIEKQEQFNQELLKRLDEQNEYITKRLDQQDNRLAQRDKLFMDNMNQLMEQRKEEIKLLEQATEDKPSWFAKIFNKKR